MRRLWDDWGRVAKKALKRRNRVYFMDFDGTLARIEQSPSSVTIAQEEFSALSALSRTRGCRLAIISGRPLRDLIARVGSFKRAIYVGNHGLEMSGAGLHPPADALKARRLRARVARAAKALTSAFKGVPGVLVENKVYGVSLHYRGVPRRFAPLFRSIFLQVKGRFSGAGLDWTRGKKVEELRPAAEWNKGSAARYILGRLGNFYPIAIGDDLTDEDLFRAVNGKGVSVRVGRSSGSVAQYYVESQADVARLLRMLAG